MSNARLEHRDGFKPKLIALSVAACFSVSAANSSANPTGGTVASGSATFASSGNTLTITNTAGAIINWQSFSIGANEITRFLQSSASSSVLNRVVGKNGAVPQSVIDGILASNGRVFLLNSSGILIGAGARIDVAGFIASSLNLSDQDYRAGRMRFTETPGAGPVSNAGTIDTSSSGPGGRVFLIAPDVQNSGIIRTPQGEIILAAGKTVDLASESSPFVTVSITADAEQALNVGKLVADSGRIGMFGALVRQGGVAEANSAVVGANGEIRLVATKDLTLDAGSVTTANGPSGGNVLLQAQGGTNLVYGSVEAKGTSGQGGTIQALGVRVGVLGTGVIDASGDAGGGTVLVGGDQHGANPNVQNAQQTLIGPDGVIRADAANTGDGGRVIVWSDAYTQMYGSASARGGAQSGNGGFIETSSGAGMDLTGVRIDARAPNGKGGTWLIDPLDIVIEPNTYANPYIFTGGTLGFNNNPGQTLHITEQTIENNFASVGNTSLQATQDVLFHANLNLVYGTVTPVQTFEVRAQRNIDLAADGIAHSITTNGQNVTLSANDLGPNSITAALNPVGTGAIIGGGSSISTNGGNVVLSGYGIAVGAVSTSPINPIIVGAGYVSMLSSGGDIVTGSITTHAVSPPTAQVSPGGYVTLTTTYGNILVNGSIDSRGANGFDTRSSAQGTDGGSVVLVRGSQTTAGKITVTGDVLTSGGDGVATSATLSGIPVGGAGGYINIGSSNLGLSGVGASVYGDIVVGGNMIARGGNGGAFLVQSAAGGSGGLGGNIDIRATNTLQIGSSSQNVVDASGGNGGAGGAAAVGAIAGVGGFGGTGGTIKFQAGQPVLDPNNGALQTISGGQAFVNSAVSSNGGAGGAGGVGSPAYGLPGGVGGSGGQGGGIAVLAGGSVTTLGAISANGGAGGIGGAYAGVGGQGGSGGGFFTTSGGIQISAPVVSIQAALSADGGKGGDGASSGGSGLTGGGGNTGGFGGGILIGPVDGAAGGTITIGSAAAPVTISARGGAGGSGGAGDPTSPGGDGGQGSSGGNITLGQTFVGGVVGSSSILAYGLITIDAGAGGNGGANGGNGGFGGSNVVDGLTGVISAYGSSITLGNLSANGGAGGNAGNGGNVTNSSGLFDLGNGGFGGDGGTIIVTATGNVALGTVTAVGGNGGVGGSNITLTVYGNANIPTADSITASGGDGGFGGTLTITTPGTVSADTIAVSGGAGGAAGTGGNLQVVSLTNQTTQTANAIADLGQGGSGGSGGTVNITAGGDVNINSIAANGGVGAAGGSGGSVLAYAYATLSNASAEVDGAGLGGFGGFGGSVNVNGTAYGKISIGTITVSGGAGGAAGSDSSSASASTPNAAYTAAAIVFSSGSGGSGNSGGSVNVNGGYGDVALGTVTANGGAGAAGNGGGAVSVYAYAPSLAASAVLTLGAGGGQGGSGGSVSVNGNNISMTGAIDVAGANGADAASVSTVSVTAGGLAPSVTVQGGDGGDGGFGGSIVVGGTGLVTLGAITSFGGNGGNGANVPNSSSIGGFGGRGGTGGDILIYGASVSTGPITAHGGNGGNGGATTSAGGLGGFGGDGAEGGSVLLLASTSATVSGAIDISGGRGGNGGSSISGVGGFGGFGGSNASVYVILDPATISVGSISAQGGAGGNGGSGLQGGSAGGGGQGAYGTSAYGSGVDIFATGSMTVGSIDASGGAGGTGGVGTSLGGYGGSGGAGGLVDLFAGTSLAPGTILVGSELSVNVAGGAGGAGGATGGVSGLAGLSGTLSVNGTIVIAAQNSSTLDTNTVIQGTNQAATIVSTNTAPSSDDIEKKNEDNKKKNQAAACK